MKKIKIIGLSLIFIVSMLILSSCEDALPNDYIPRNYVEAYLIVGEPIQHIILMKSQPVMDSLNYFDALIKDAQVRLKKDNLVFNLQFNQDRSNPGYFYPDTTYHVEPNANYILEIMLKDSTVISGTTLTPSVFNWTKTTAYNIYYPKDTVMMPKDSSLNISWNEVPTQEFYLLSLKCLDTLSYGKYFNPQTDEKNRRIMRPWNHDEMYYEINNWALIPNTTTPVVWGAFKWYGLHEVSIFAPDANMLKWFIQYIMKGQYDRNLGSVSGNGIGVFGSASVVRDTIFLNKNQP